MLAGIMEEFSVTSGISLQLRKQEGLHRDTGSTVQPVALKRFMIITFLKCFLVR